MTRLIAVLAFIAALAPIGRAQPVDAGHALVELIAERDAAAPGDTFSAALKLDLDDGWHVYWINPGDAGLPPVINWKETSGATIGDFVWPAPHELPVVEGEIMDYGYDKQLVLPFEVTLPADVSGEITLAGLADYLICSDICIPEQADISLTLPIWDDPVVNPIASDAILTAKSAAPTAFNGEARINRNGEDWTLSLNSMEFASGGAYLRFFPFDHDIVHSAPQFASYGPDGATIKMTGASDDASGPLNGVVVLEGEAGARAAWEISAAPGEPFAGATGSAIGPAGSLGSGLAGTSGGSAFTGGGGLFLVLALAVLGGLVLNLMPCVLPVLSIKAIGLAQSAASGDAGHLRLHGLVYMAGVVVSMLLIAAILIGLKGAGETVGIGMQLQYPPLVAGFALLIFVIGLNLYGMFEIGGSLVGVGQDLTAKQGLSGAFFTGVLATLLGAPCIGPFLGAASGWALSQSAGVIAAFFLAMGIGLALPFTLISFAPGLQSLLPKPGAWMVRLRQVFAFPMFLTAIWLVWVLAIGSAGPNAAAATLAGAVFIAFGIWLMNSVEGAKSGLRRAGVAVGALALVGGVAFPVQAAMERRSELAVNDWSVAAVEAARAEDRIVFVDFTAAWCVTCQLNKNSTLRNAKVVRTMADVDVAFFEADWTDRNQEIADELARHGRAGIPLYLLYAPGADEPEILPQILTPNLVTKAVKAAAN
ncbi:MAG: protein-disulfide reductase DsbD domain-containing protein [Pseudomonadota bacterium]